MIDLLWALLFVAGILMTATGAALLGGSEHPPNVRWPAGFSALLVGIFLLLISLRHILELL